MKACGGVDVQIHVFLTLALVVGEISFTPRAALLPGKEPQYPLDRRLGGPQSRSGRHGEVKILDPTGTRNSDPSGRPAHSQSLYRLRYPGSH
jgi:hypothetical protein